MSLEAGPTDMAHLRYFRGDTTFGPFEMLAWESLWRHRTGNETADSWNSNDLKFHTEDKPNEKKEHCGGMQLVISHAAEDMQAICCHSKHP